MRFGALVVLCLSVGCSSHDPVSPPSVSDYYPLKQGAWFQYRVDSVVTDQGVATSYAYDLKIEVLDSLAVPEGQYLYVLQRSKRNDESSPWMSLTTWSVRFTGLQVVEMEGNIPFIKISAPLQNGTVWNGNELNALGGKESCATGGASDCDLYAISDFGSAATVASVVYPNTMTVIESNDNDMVVGPDLRSELYARNVGLLSRSITQAQYCSMGDCLGQHFVDHGVSYVQTLTSYGGL